MMQCGVPVRPDYSAQRPGLSVIAQLILQTIEENKIDGENIFFENIFKDEIIDNIKKKYESQLKDWQEKLAKFMNVSDAEIIEVEEKPLAAPAQNPDEQDLDPENPDA